MEPPETHHLYPVERQKHGVFTGNVGKDVGRETKGPHRLKRKSRANADVTSVTMDTLSMSSSERPPDKLSRKS